MNYGLGRYLMAALAATCGYSVVTLVASATAVRKASPSTKLLLHLIILDTVIPLKSRNYSRKSTPRSFGNSIRIRRWSHPMLNWMDVQTMAGVLAAATGAGGGVAYIGLKGNSHVRWNKICGVYDNFCRHVGSAVGVSLIASIVLVLLVILSACSLYRRAH